MRKFLSVGVVALFVMVAAVVPASAHVIPSGSSAFGASSVVWEQRYIQWLFGSDTNPLMQDGLCGQSFNGVLFLNAATIPDFEADCTVKAGTQILASPGGTVEWAPTNGTTDEQLLAQLAIDETAIANPAATVDGRAINVTDGFTRGGAYTISVGADSFIKSVDPTFPSDLTETRAASSAWIARLTPLTPGTHTLVLSDTIGGDPFVATFHITVTH
jgi:hypothetical protein